jgi:hypothetical protein
MAAHGLAKFFGDAAAKLDGQIGNAEASIHYVRLNEGASWAGVDAFCAGAAEVRWR